MYYNFQGDLYFVLSYKMIGAWLNAALIHSVCLCSLCTDVKILLIQKFSEFSAEQGLYHKYHCFVIERTECPPAYKMSPILWKLMFAKTCGLISTVCAELFLVYCKTWRLHWTGVAPIELIICHRMEFRMTKAVRSFVLKLAYNLENNVGVWKHTHLSNNDLSTKAS